MPHIGDKPDLPRHSKPVKLLCRLPMAEGPSGDNKSWRDFLLSKKISFSNYRKSPSNKITGGKK